MNTPKVSVIIATKNEEKHIEKCLDSVRNQTYKNIEVIVVDNFSSDNTQKIAKKFTTKVFSKGPERSAQRNFGILTKSTGYYILFLDADMHLSPKVIEACVRRLGKNPEIVGLYMKEIVERDGFFGDIRRFERSFYDGTVIDGLRFFKKETFRKIGGFDEALYACEDWDLDKRFKREGRTDIINEPIFHNETDDDVVSYIKKKAYYAQNFDTYIHKWGVSDTDIKKQFGFHYRYFGVFTENGKWRKIITHPVLTLGLLFLKCMVGCLYLFRSTKE